MDAIRNSTDTEGPAVVPDWERDPSQNSFKGSVNGFVRVSMTACQKGCRKEPQCSEPFQGVFSSRLI